MEELIFDEEKLKAMLVELRAQRAVIVSQTDALQTKRDALWRKMDEVKREWGALGTEIARIEVEGDLATVSRNIVKILKVLKPESVRSLAAEPGSFGVKVGR